MVYRGKPSAGCDNCRKAKKRCTLERPACLRCIKLNKTCSGYRDVSQLQIRDETATTMRKAQLRTVQQQPELSDEFRNLPHERVSAARIRHSVNHDSTINSFSILEEGIGFMDNDTVEVNLDLQDWATAANMKYFDSAISDMLRPKPDDIADMSFYNSFTTGMQNFTLLRYCNVEFKNNPTVKLAIRACGMAVLENKHSLPIGQRYGRAMYGEALKHLNAALRNPESATTDQSLTAVTLLAYYENIACDGVHSYRSWGAHIQGAAQLLRLRGKDQFKTPIGRMLFRLTWTQNMALCLWDDSPLPSIYQELKGAYQEADTRQNPTPANDMLLQICADYATLRADMRLAKLADQTALELANTIEVRMVRWAAAALDSSSVWRYTDFEVQDSPHVWNGMVHEYKLTPAPVVWNTWRLVRIMLSRTQEMLVNRLCSDRSQGNNQTCANNSLHDCDTRVRQYRNVRRKMADEICAAVPVLLGHAAPAPVSACVLVTAYNSIWSIFAAATCALERIGPDAIHWIVSGQTPPINTPSAPWLQAIWLIGRLEHIARVIGIRWAEGVVATLRGDLKVYGNILARPHATTDTDKNNPVQLENAPWVQNIENAHRGPTVLLDPSHKRQTRTVPVWLGRGLAYDERFDSDSANHRTSPLESSSDDGRQTLVVS